MNTKSIVAAVKKPKAAPKVAKAVVKKPKAAPKVAKAVVKKLKATPKVAKAVVKKPKATPKVAKAVVKKPKATPKVAKAVVKKPIRGGGGKELVKYVKSMFGTRSNAILPTSNRLTQVIEETPIVEELQKAPIEECMQQSPSILLNKILGDYKTIFVDKILGHNLTVYDLLVLIENIANNLNKFFEDFLHYYPIIIFKVKEEDKGTYLYFDRSILKFQDKFVKINSIIRKYIKYLGSIHYPNYEFRNTKFPQFEVSKKHISYLNGGVEYLDTSKVVYNGILDGTQKGIKEYKRSRLNFFKFEYILELKDYEKMSDNKNPLTLYKDYRLIFGDSFDLGEIGDLDKDIINGLYEVLRDFFNYIEFMKINSKIETEINPEIIAVCRKYIEDAKKTAKKNLVALNGLYETLKLGMKNIDRHQPTGYSQGYHSRNTKYV